MWLAGLSIAFLTLLLLATLRRSMLARIAAVALALGVLVFASPNEYRALRRTVSLPAGDRVTTDYWTHRSASPYESGIFTMYREARRDAEQDATYRYLAVASLAVFAAVPARSPRPRRTTDVNLAHVL